MAKKSFRLGDTVAFKDYQNADRVGTVIQSHGDHVGVTYLHTTKIEDASENQALNYVYGTTSAQVFSGDNNTAFISSPAYFTGQPKQFAKVAGKAPRNRNAIVFAQYAPQQTARAASRRSR